MCFGGGAKKGYDAYKGGNGSDFNRFENRWDQWSQQELNRAENGVDYSKLNNVDAFKNQIRHLSKDPRAQMELTELQRQHAIDLGKIAIDQNFEKFNPAYYKGYKQDYRDYYSPQVKDQFNETTGKLNASLVDRGLGESSVGNAAKTGLFKDYTQANTNIANEALDASNKLRSQVQSQKSNLYSLNEASADPMGVNAQAIGASTSLVAPPTYSPLGQLFTSALQPFAAYQTAQQNSPTRQYSSPYSTPQGSSRVIG